MYLIDDTVELCASGRADRVDNRLVRALRCNGLGVFRSTGFYREKTVRHAYPVTCHLAGTQGHANSYPDEKSYANTAACERADSVSRHLAGTQDHADSYPDEKSHADASSNKYANLNQHTNTDISRSPDICATTNPHTNSNKAADSDAHTYEYTTP